MTVSSAVSACAENEPKARHRRSPRTADDRRRTRRARPRGRRVRSSLRRSSSGIVTSPRFSGLRKRLSRRSARSFRSGRCYNPRCVAGWSSQVARRAHNPEVAGSNPAPAMNNLLRSAALERPFAFQGPIGSTNSVTATPAGAAVVNGGLRIEIPVRRSPRPRRPRLPLEFVRELAGGNPAPRSMDGRFSTSPSTTRAECAKRSAPELRGRGRPCRRSTGRGG